MAAQQAPQARDRLLQAVVSDRDVFPPGLQQVVIQTTTQNTLLISDSPGPTGGILLKSSTGALISVSDIGITISNGQGATIIMTGPAVTVNEGALEVI